MRLVLSGYYGFNNSGDEAVLKSILTALEQAGGERGVRVEPVVLSADPSWTSRQYGVEAVPRMKPGEVWKALRGSDGLISGGGSLLQDATGLGSIPYYLGIMELARWCGKPTFIYAQGIGPVNRPMFRLPIARAFRKAAYVSVRDGESAELLRRFGVPGERIEVVPDPVMGLPLRGEAPVGDGRGIEPNTQGVSRADSDRDIPVVGVSVRFWRGDRADLDRIAAGLAALAQRRSMRFRFLPFHHGSDEDASRYVMERIATAAQTVCELAPAHDDPQAMLREVGQCSLLIGMRLHSLIYAANQGVPLLGISYDPKIDQFLHQLGQQPAGSTEALEPDIFADHAARLLDNPDNWKTAAYPFIEQLKQKARRPAQQIIAQARI